jgi:hypothetical protein
MLFILHIVNRITFGTKLASAWRIKKVEQTNKDFRTRVNIVPGTFTRSTCPRPDNGRGRRMTVLLGNDYSVV